MTNSIHCITVNDLECFLANTLPEKRSIEIEGHLDSCPECCQSLCRMAGNEDWWHDVETAMQESQEPTFTIQRSHGEYQLLLGLLGPTDDPDKLGRIGPYEVVGIIGRGGMGAVFKAHDPGLNRFVALKVLLPHLAASGEARARFRREGQAAAAVVNDHILPIYGVDEWKSYPYLVMQYIRGSTLQQRLCERGALRLKELLRITLHAAKGLAAAHAQGLVHRDIKPSNILLDGTVERAVLSDFGLARAVDDTSLTRSGMLAGTPQFMSPEQIRGESIDQRSDLFSLGSVLYAMSTGIPPFRSESSYTVMRQIIEEFPRPIREFRDDAPDWLQRLVDSLMEKDPARRPASAKDVEQIIEKCLAHLEQPQLVSLPIELSQSKVTSKQRNPKRMIMLSLATFTLGLLPFLGGNMLLEESENSPNEQRQGEQEKPNAMKDLKGSTTAGSYRIEMLGTGPLDGMESLLDFKPDIKIQNGQGNSFGNITTNNFGNSQTSNNQNGTGGAVGGFGTTTAGGGGGGFAGTGGATYSGGGIPANLGIALKIEADKAKAKGKREFVELSPKIKLTNNDGSTNESEDTRPLRTSYPQFEKQFPGCYAAYVHRPRGTDSTIKTIEGELLVTPGRKLSAVFTDSKPQKKKVDGEIFQLQKLESNQQGTMVQMTFPETALMKKANNMFEKFQAFTQSTGSFDVMLVDYDGNVYLAHGKSGSGGASGSVQGFSFNGTTQTRTNQSQEPSMTTMNFQFKPLPQGTEITKIIAVMTEKEGETKAIPFTMDLTEK